MNPQTRKTYFGMWTAACKVQGWKGDAKRKEITLWVMNEVRAPITDSITDLKPPAVTALFTYLALAADPDNVEKNAAWVNCCRDYVSFNQLRQAKWWEKQTGYKGRIRAQRFDGRLPETELDEPASEKDVKEYLLTARGAHDAKFGKRPRKQFHYQPEEDTGLKPRNEPQVPIVDGIAQPF